MALEIFTDAYPKNSCTNLVSGQLDVDRMDYLNRDSFFHRSDRRIDRVRPHFKNADRS